MTPSDWVLVWSTIALGSIALFGPYLNELWKRKKFAPKLRITFQKEYPYVTEPKGDIYSICFGVKNEGDSKSINCEAVIEEFYFKNEEGDLTRNTKDFPSKLALAGDSGYYFIRLPTYFQKLIYLFTFFILHHLANQNIQINYFFP